MVRVQDYRHALERAVETAEEIVLTSHYGAAGITIQEDLVHRLSKELIEARQLRQRVNHSLGGADDDVHAQTIREGF